jgi:hypothetical protein
MVEAPDEGECCGTRAMRQNAPRFPERGLGLGQALRHGIKGPMLV